MVRPVIVGLGAAGALSAAAVTGVSLMRENRAAPPPAPGAAALETVCIETKVRLVEGMSPACYARADFEAMRDRRVISANGDPVRLTLSPESAGPEETVETCVQYDALVSGGYAALSGADMRREEYFRRACGALGLLAGAAPARVSNFNGGKASAEDVRSMAAAEATGFGEPQPGAPVDVAAVGDGVWRIAIGQGETMVYEIAHADFTGDGAGEILAYLSVGAAGGTARSGAIGLMEKSTPAGPCGFNPR